VHRNLWLGCRAVGEQLLELVLMQEEAKPAKQATGTLLTTVYVDCSSVVTLIASPISSASGDISCTS